MVDEDEEMSEETDSSEEFSSETDYDEVAIANHEDENERENCINSIVFPKYRADRSDWTCAICR